MKMRLVRTVPALRRETARWRRRGETVGFVPTMGALHAGHRSLVARARRDCDRVVVSVFVNPLQFGPREDFSRYPRTLREDLALCREAGVDVVFAPSARAMYPDGFETHVDQERLPQPMCGASRPGHFRGVLTVVSKLLNQVGPDVAYFGRKDYQQSAIVRRMVRDLDFPVRIVVMPTVREPDGLAMSSRNRRLSPDARRRASALWRALRLARRLIRGGERRAGAIERAMRSVIRSAAGPSAKIDYIVLADPDTLQPVARVDSRILIALAVRIGGVRLIDNLLASPR